MEWTQSLRKAIEYMEQHICDPIGPADVAAAVNISAFYLQKGFQILTGYSLMEYLRNRRLYSAALDLLSGDDKVIDVAYKYCYQTPESFAKAFARYHGFPPSLVKKERARIRPFLPLKLKISIQGGNNVDFQIEKMDSFQVIGFKKEIPMGRGYELCPQFWDEIQQKYLIPLWQGKPPKTDVERAIVECNVGMFGICIDGAPNPELFTYMAAGRYDGRPIPEGMAVVEIPAATWAEFKALGPLPESLQDLNTRIFQQWLPENPQYELALPINIELYSDGKNGPDYESFIWLPVTEK